jgi:hypothetical protein
VFFVLISLTLGIFLYLAQDKIAAADKARDQAKSEQAELQKTFDDVRNWYAIQMRDWWNVSANPQERQDADQMDQRMKSRQAGDPRPEAFGPVRNEIEGMLGKTPNPTVQTTYLKGRLELLEKQLADMKKNKETFEGEYTKTKTAFETYQKEWNAERLEREKKKQADDLKAQHDLVIAEKDKAIQAAHDRIAAVTKDLDTRLTDEKTKMAAEKKLIEQKVQEETDKLAEFRKELKEKHEASAQVRFDEKSPKVLRADVNSDTVFIDVGEGDRVTPGLTFNVYERGPGGKPSLSPKASIEVIGTVGKGVSMARIKRVAKPEIGRVKKDGNQATFEEEEYWITDPRDFWKNRNPIQKDDLLNNPAYSRDRVIHVFLAGMFDLDGDGTDDLGTLRRWLQERGAEVDGYLDPASQYETKGRMDYQTEYMIRGVVPVGGAAGGVRSQFEKLEEDAKKKGIRVMDLRRFLAEMGFTNLRVPSQDPRGGAPAAPRANGEKKAEEESK